MLRYLKTERAQFLIDNLDLPEAAQYEGAVWEDFQIRHLEDDNPLRIESKSRQIAWSFTCAAEAVAKAILDKRNSIFQSMNLDEAQEKIRYARNVLYALSPEFRPKLVTENKSELEFDNGARIISLPGTPSRGKAQFDVYLDEWAHMMYDRDIYTAILPVLSKGEATLRGGSSPMGASGLFWEIFKEEISPYPGFTRKITPWWQVQAFCTDVLAAYHEAPNLTTAQRAAKFGNERIQLIFENMPLEDFQQEYEAIFVDETTAWISWELIKKNQTENMVFHHITSHDDVEKLIQDVQTDILAGRIEPALVGGLDIGRVRDLTEFCGLGRSTSGHLPLRTMVSLANTPYEHQEHCIYRLITGLPFTSVLIDQNGIGNQLAEGLSNTTRGIAEGVTFTNATKELWAVNARVKFDQGLLPIPIFRELAYQIHSIKKKVTAAKNNVFDTEASEKHHADKFWSLALAAWAGRESSSTLHVGVNPLAGYRG